MEVVTGIGAAFLGVLLLTTVVSLILAIRHRKPQVAWTRLLVSRAAFFDVDNFTSVGQRHQRRALLAGLTLSVCALLGPMIVFVVSEA